jgi:hypothetical protein
MSWTRDFIWGAFGLRPADRDRHTSRPLRWDNVRPASPQIAAALAVARRTLGPPPPRDTSPLPPIDDGWWNAVARQAKATPRARQTPLARLSGMSPEQVAGDPEAMRQLARLIGQRDPLDDAVSPTENKIPR